MTDSDFFFGRRVRLDHRPNCSHFARASLSLSLSLSLISSRTVSHACTARQAADPESFPWAAFDLHDDTGLASPTLGKDFDYMTLMQTPRSDADQHSDTASLFPSIPSSSLSEKEFAPTFTKLVLHACFQSLLASPPRPRRTMNKFLTRSALSALIAASEWTEAISALNLALKKYRVEDPPQRRTSRHATA